MEGGAFGVVFYHLSPQSPKPKDGPSMLGLLAFFDGWKTYMAGLALILLALGGFLQALVDGTSPEWDRTLEQLLLGWAIMSGRAAMNKVAGKP